MSQSTKVAADELAEVHLKEARLRFPRPEDVRSELDQLVRRGAQQMSRRKRKEAA